MAYPSTISTLATPNPTDRLNSPSHSTLHQNENTGITELQTFVGTLSSTQGTLIYDIRASASDGGGHVQSANKGGTGQTSFNKGDILVATSSSVITKLAVGTDGQALIANSSVAAGVQWGSSSKPNLTKYQPSSVTNLGISSFLGTWVKPANLTYAVIEIVGGGGGGGGNNATNSGGAGGGGGGYSRYTVVASALPTAASVIVGIAGNGGITTGAGSVGGVTYFGSVLSGTGGSPGGQGNASDGGSGGTATGGDINASGQKGGSGGSQSSGNDQGMGGASYFAGGPGSGGEGGRGNTAGTAGKDGLVIIYEY